ncbi:hypothetical protein EJB05_14133, partial [Eragrostis curvula]
LPCPRLASPCPCLAAALNPVSPPPRRVTSTSPPPPSPSRRRAWSSTPSACGRRHLPVDAASTVAVPSPRLVLDAACSWTPPARGRHHLPMDAASPWSFQWQESRKWFALTNMAVVIFRSSYLSITVDIHDVMTVHNWFDMMFVTMGSSSCLLC